METSVGTDKLAQLTAKTDRQLHILISDELNRGLAFARLLLDEEARERLVCLDEFAAKAEKAHREVSRLLPFLRGVTAAERRRLQSRLSQLREILDCAAICAVPRIRTAACW